MSLYSLLLAGASNTGGSGGPVDPLVTPAKYALTVRPDDDRVTMINVENTTDFVVSSDLLVNPSILYPYDVQIDQTTDIAYVVGYSNNSITAIDISDKSNKTILSTLSSTVYFSQPRRLELDTVNKIAYVVNYIGSSISAIDISNPLAMAGIGKLTDSTNLYTANSIALDLFDGFAFVGSVLVDKLVSIDISDPANMSVIDVYSNGLYMDRPTDIAIDTDFPPRLFVSLESENTITRMSYNNSGFLQFEDNVSGFNINRPRAIAYNPVDGIVYVANNTGDSISKVSPTFGEQDTETSTIAFNDIIDIEIDYHRSLIFAVTYQDNAFSSLSFGPSGLSVQHTEDNAAFDNARNLALYYEEF
jgi:DNA-binding beta-propeller fold protein YncE